MLVSHINAHQRPFSVGEAFNKQIDMMTHSVSGAVSLSDAQCMLTRR